MRLRVAGDFDFERDSWKSCRPSNILKVVAAVVDATSVVCFSTFKLILFPSLSLD